MSEFYFYPNYKAPKESFSPMILCVLWKVYDIKLFWYSRISRVIRSNPILVWYYTTRILSPIHWPNPTRSSELDIRPTHQNSQTSFQISQFAEKLNEIWKLDKLCNYHTSSLLPNLSIHSVRGILFNLYFCLIKNHLIISMLRIRFWIQWIPLLRYGSKILLIMVYKVWINNERSFFLYIIFYHIYNNFSSHDDMI